MSLEKIKLTDYDNVVAVTQVAINQTMGEYLAAHPTDVALYGKEDGDTGNVILVPDAKDADYIFTGKLAPEKVGGTWINIVQLYTDKGNQTVQYNATFKSGEFKVVATNRVYKQDSNTPWVFEFFVKLAMQEVAKSDLPDEIKRKLINVDENMFSIQQLYLDLNMSSLASAEGIKVPSLIKSAMTAMVQGHLAQQQKQHKPLFGVTVHFKDKNVSPPTLTPTNVNFCVTPYRDGTGNISNHNLDTLNYLVMTNHHPPPAFPPQSFPFNWVSDVNNHGAMAIKQRPFAEFIVGPLNPLLKILCPVVHCKPDVHKTPDQQQIDFDPGTDHVFESAYDDATGKIAFCNYESSDDKTSRDRDNFGHMYSESLKANYRMSCEVFLNKDTDRLKISGSITIDASHGGDLGDGNRWTEVMPKTIYPWSVELQLYMDPSNNGQLDFKVVSKDFDRPPTVEKHEESAWEKFLNGFGGQHYVENVGNVRAHVRDHVTGSVADALQKALEKANHFIFPGAKTFTFKNPTFTDSRDLASNITYLNPNA